jgi:hypothetical protein
MVHTLLYVHVQYMYVHVHYGGHVCACNVSRPAERVSVPSRGVEGQKFYSIIHVSALSDLSRVHGFFVSFFNLSI